MSTRVVAGMHHVLKRWCRQAALAAGRAGLRGLGLAVALGATGSLPGPAAAQTLAAADANTGIRWVRVGGFEIAQTETTVAQFRRFVQASGTRTRAEAQGGGEVYESGWVRKPGWVWHAPFGKPAADDEPAVHVGFDEAQAFCRWAGGRLPSDAQWVSAAYLEQRSSPAAGYVTGRRYPFPTGDSAEGAQCLDGCGPEARGRALNHGAALTRGQGHALAGRSRAGVNGLFDMGGNAWEWVDEPPQARDIAAERRTRGGSWWYGPQQMREDALQAKPGTTAVVYIGFRCVKG